MFSRELLIALYRHMEWADAAVWAAVPLDAADARLKELLVHLHVVQRSFLTVWTGGDLRAVYRESNDFATLADVRGWARPYYGAAQAFLEEAPEERLNATLALPWAAMLTEQLGRPIGESTLGDTAFQVSSHSTYHRGQVNLRLRELGATPPLVDYIAWLWFQRPAPEWGS